MYSVALLLMMTSDPQHQSRRPTLDVPLNNPRSSEPTTTMSAAVQLNSLSARLRFGRYSSRGT